jgi:DNA-binding transcriptional LysR family regulator
VYYEACRDIVRRYEEMEGQLDSLKSELEGSVRVASIYSIGLYEMARLKQEFEHLHPQTNIHLDYVRPEKVYQAVADDQADLGLVSYPHSTKDARVVPWRTEEMVLVCPPLHPLAQRELIRPADLEGQDFVSFDPDLSIRKAMDRFFRDHGVQRQVVLEFDNIQMIKEAVAIGSGISILPKPTVEQEVAQRRLAAIPIDAEGFGRPIGIIHGRKKTLSPAAAKFLRFLSEHSHR